MTSRITTRARSSASGVGVHGNGTWVVRVADGKGSNWTDGFAHADDHEDSNAAEILTWWQAIEAARRVARGSADAGKPPTVKDAIDAYGRDLVARGGSPVNASRLRKHLTPAMLGTLVGLLTARELAAWRDSLLAAGVTKATTVRLSRCLAAALNLAARRDPARISNSNSWQVGLAGLTNTYTPVNRVLSDNDVLRLVAEAYALDPHFGLFVDVLASTGTRTSQACALLVGDLQADRRDPRLLMPASKKGRGKQKSVSHRPVPIPTGLSRRLRAAAGDRGPDEPLLVRSSDGRRWDPSKEESRILFAKVAERTGIDCTAYSLRHSSIVRSLLAGTPAQLVASLHDSSVLMLTRTYAHFISHFGDEVARRGLLDTDVQLPGDNVHSLRGRP